MTPARIKEHDDRSVSRRSDRRAVRGGVASRLARPAEMTARRTVRPGRPTLDRVDTSVLERRFSQRGAGAHRRCPMAVASSSATPRGRHPAEARRVQGVLARSVPHQGCPVDDVANGRINCPCHGSMFSIEGRCGGSGARPCRLSASPSRSAVKSSTSTVRARLARTPWTLALYRPAAGSDPRPPRGLPLPRRLTAGWSTSARPRASGAGLGQYFQDLGCAPPAHRTPWSGRRQSVTWTVVATEVEALQLEYAWIKEFDPRFNVKYRDDKSYPFLAVSVGEDFPRAAGHAGLQTQGRSLLRPVLACLGDPRDPRPAAARLPDPVLQHAACSSGPGRWGVRVCWDTSTSARHRVSTASRRTSTGLSSTTSAPSWPVTPVGSSRTEQQDAGGVSRPGVRAGGAATRRHRGLGAGAGTKHHRPADDTDADVIAMVEDALEAAFHVFHVRGGRVRGQRGYVVDRVEDTDRAGLIEHLLLQLYGAETGRGIPREILVPELPRDAAAMSEWLQSRKGAQVDLRVPRRGDKRSLLATVTRNAEQTLVLHKTRRASDLTARSQALAELQDGLELPQAPLRIECIDVSNLQGSEVVASLVVFEDGLPRKSEYRRFAIRGFDGQDDVASIHEVVTRRFRRYLEEREDLPDLEIGSPGYGPAEHPRPGIDEKTGRPRKFAYAPNLLVVDGGAPQVAAAQRALDALGIDDVSVVGLAKRLEEIFLPGRVDPVILSRTSEGLYLLQRVRDEAHRFAITFHRQRRSKSMTTSALEQVPGLGDVRRKALLRRFGSVKRLRAATAEEIAEVPGVGLKTAQAVAAALALPSHAQAGVVVNTATGEILDDVVAKGGPG